MTYKPGYLRERSRDIINARNWSVGIITTLLGLGLFVSEVQRIRALPLEIMQYAYLGVFILTGLLIFLWIWATQKELNLLFEWLDPERYVPPTTILETLAILFIGIVLTSLLFASRSPLLYGAVFTAYSAVLIPLGAYTNREIAGAIFSSKKRAERDISDEKLAVKAGLYLQGIDALELYFLRRPHVPRLVSILIASAIATVVAFWWRLYGSQTAGMIAYFLFAGILVVSEVVIAHWRCVRDGSLRSILAELAECQRGEDKSPNQVPTLKNEYEQT